MFILDPDFLAFGMPNLESRIQQEKTRRGEIFLLSCLFCSHKFHNIENYFISEKVQKDLSNLTKN
jgi:hypothetical protein